MDLVLKNVKKKDFPVLKSLAKSLGFEIVEKNEESYNPEFVKEILEAAKEVREGKGVKMAVEDLDKLWK
jgi:3-polyprenyl-4-hydroxybenzoate decarboxylase